MIGNLEARIEMLINMHKDEAVNSTTRRKEVHEALEGLRSDVQSVKHDIRNLRARVDAVEPAAEKVRQWSTSKTAIVTLFTVLVSGLGAIGASFAALLQWASRGAGN